MIETLINENVVPQFDLEQDAIDWINANPTNIEMGLTARRVECRTCANGFHAAKKAISMSRGYLLFAIASSLAFVLSVSLLGWQEIESEPILERRNNGDAIYREYKWRFVRWDFEPHRREQISGSVHDGMVETKLKIGGVIGRQTQSQSRSVKVDSTQ